VASFSLGKAHSVAQDDPEAMVLGSDTVIEVDEKVLGKPADLVEARTMLLQLAGRSHLVHTAITLSCLTRRIDITEVSTAIVRMKAFDAATYERYLATGDSLGKAGAYSIQGPGGELIEKLHGDFPTVVGLPLRLLATLLPQVGITVPVDVDQLYRARPYGNWPRFPG
jgi:septum formation protein